jgi:hypothetical protein
MSIRAGAAAIEITPPEAVALAGFAGKTRVSTGVRDPLYASAIHLRGGSGGLIVVSLDLHTLTPRYARSIRQQIYDATGIAHAQILVGTTQTHAGPVVTRDYAHFNEASYAEPDAAYMEFVASAAVEAAGEAAVASQPAAMAAVSLGKPNTAALLVKDLQSNRIVSSIVVYDAIPNLLGPENTQLSSDVVEPLRRRLTAKFGGSPVIAYLAAPTGDQRLESPVTQGSEEGMIQTGKGIADMIVAGVRRLTADDFRSDISFDGSLEEIWDLPLKALPSELDAAYALNDATDKVRLALTGSDELAKLIARWHLNDMRGQRGLVAAREAGLYAQLTEQYRSTDIQMLRIGGTRLLCVPAALLSDCAQALAKHVDFPVLIAECLNGDMLGSILNAPQSEEAGFSLLSPIFHSSAGEPIAALAHELLAENA